MVFGRRISRAKVYARDPLGEKPGEGFSSVVAGVLDVVEENQPSRCGVCLGIASFCKFSVKSSRSIAVHDVVAGAVCNEDWEGGSKRCRIESVALDAVSKRAVDRMIRMVERIGNAHGERAALDLSSQTVKKSCDGDEECTLLADDGT